MKIKFKSQKPKKKKMDRRNQVHLFLNPDVFSELSQIELPVFTAPRQGSCSWHSFVFSVKLLGMG